MKLWLVFLTLFISETAYAAPATRPSLSLTTPRGHLSISATQPACGEGWSVEVSEGAVDASVFRKATSVRLLGRNGRWRVSSSKPPTPGETWRLEVTQDIDGVSVSYTARTTTPDPDPIYLSHYRSLAELYEKAAHIGRYLDEALRLLDPDWLYSPGPLVDAQNGDWVAPDGCEEAVCDILSRFDSPDWRVREHAVADAVNDSGVSVWLLLKCPTDLTDEQGRCRDRVLACYAILE